MANWTAPKEGNPQKEMGEDIISQATPSIVEKSSGSGCSLLNKVAYRQARRVKFYRNGDRFFKGVVFVVSNERFRTFESLLSALTTSTLCDWKSMPKGVRYIFSLDGARSIESVDELLAGQSYVCSSVDSFRLLDYTKNEDYAWNTHSFHHHEPNNAATANTSGHARSEVYDTNRKRHAQYERSFITPRLITLIKNGRPPRKACRFLLNRKTAQSFEQVMSDITEVIKFDSGKVKKMFTMSGQPVMCLAGLFQEDTVFLVCGRENPSSEDFILSKSEANLISSFRPFKRRPSDKVAVKKEEHLTGTSLLVAKDLTPETKQPPHKEGFTLALYRFFCFLILDLKHEVNTVSKDTTDSVLSQLPIPIALTNKYEVGKHIGKGSFAVIMECKEKKTNKKYALKIISKDLCKGKEELVDEEVRIVRCMKHPNIIRLVEDYTCRHYIFCVMELVKGGDLFDTLVTPTTKYTEQDASRMLYNLASALEYLHSLCVVHRDVKPENIIIRQHEDGTRTLKLGNFGLATEVKGTLYTICGTPAYIAPEVITETGYGLKVDVWSAGVVTFILLCGFPPFVSPRDDQDVLFDLITTGVYRYPSPYWDNITPAAKDVISSMLEMNPNLRMSAAQVLSHSWVSRDNHYQTDLRKNICQGLGIHARRGLTSAPNYAGIRILTTTALDKASMFYRGHGPSKSTAPTK